MKLDSKIKKLVDQNTFRAVVSSLLRTAPFERMLLEFSNQCIFKSNSDKNKKRRRMWHRMARVLHRAYDELNLEKQKKNTFKVMRKDYYLCPKCNKKFRVDPAKDENCKFELDRAMVVAKCPHCGHSE